MTVTTELHVTYEYTNGSSDSFFVETDNLEESKLQHLASLRLSENEWLVFTNIEGKEIHVRLSAIVKATAEVFEFEKI